VIKKKQTFVTLQGDKLYSIMECIYFSKMFSAILHVMLCTSILYSGPYLMCFIKFIYITNQNYFHLTTNSVDLQYNSGSVHHK
jgi:hypothetical protein